MKKRVNQISNGVNQYSIVICGVGGQGLITLNKVLIKAALIEGYEARTSELHGLSQRGGSVETHIRFGEKIYSPLVKKGGANLIIAIEAQEALKASYYASKKIGTVFVINDFIAPIPMEESIPGQKISESLKDFSKEVLMIPATEITQKELGNPVLAGIYLLGIAFSKKFIPLKYSSLLEAMEEIVPKQFFDLNKKTIELAQKNA